MVKTRPHTLQWLQAEAGGAKADPVTGFPLPTASTVIRSVPCRFRAGGTKEFKNKDNQVVKQTGTIRLGPGTDLPQVGQEVEVTGHFKGDVKGVYRGQLSSRIDV